jgi:uncharacterized linocin/CFP29 family protein
MYGLQQPSAQSQTYAMAPSLARIAARERAAWPHEVWGRIDDAVHAECQRIGIAAKFLPMYGPIEVTKTYVLADIVRPPPDQPVLNVDETRTTPIVEIQVFFELTRQQVEEEADRGTAVTLATRAANLLTQGKDQLIFQGRNVLDNNPLFTPGRVEFKSGQQGVGEGLVNLPNSRPDRLVVQVESLEARSTTDTQTRWGENTFAGVARAYSILQSGFDLTQAHYGPYCCVLQHVQFADTYAPLATTLIMPADRIKPLVNDCFYGTGTLPAFRGFLISTGGNTVDLVVVCAPTVAWVQEDSFGNVRFRVYEKFVVREKVNDCVVRLEFEPTPHR